MLSYHIHHQALVLVNREGELSGQCGLQGSLNTPLCQHQDQPTLLGSSSIALGIPCQGMENAAHPHKAAVLRVIPGDELEGKCGQTPTALVGDP